MDTLLDSSWMRELYSSSPMERFDRGRFSMVTVSSKATAEHHYGRYRYRMYCFENGSTRPSIAVNMESDVLGAWRLTVQTARDSWIAASFDAPPDYDGFKTLALAAAEDAASREIRNAPESKRARRPGSPRSHSP